MNKFMTLAALAAAMCLSTSAFAVQITVDGVATGLTLTPGTVAGAASTGASSAIGAGLPNTGGVAPNLSPANNTSMAVTTFATTDIELAAVKAIGESSKVRVLSVTPMGADGTAFTKAGTDMKADVTKLQDAINANTSFKTELTAKNIDVSKIMAAEVAADGSLILYVMA